MPLQSTEGTEPTNYVDKAKLLVLKHINESPDTVKKLSEEHLYVVWFSKTIQNWKALISTTVPDRTYYEITYNGDKKETYIDAYLRYANVRIPDSSVIW